MTLLLKVLKTSRYLKNKEPCDVSLHTLIWALPWLTDLLTFQAGKSPFYPLFLLPVLLMLDDSCPCIEESPAVSIVSALGHMLGWELAFIYLAPIFPWLSTSSSGLISIVKLCQHSCSGLVCEKIASHRWHNCVSPPPPWQCSFDNWRFLLAEVLFCGGAL